MYDLVMHYGLLRIVICLFIYFPLEDPDPILKMLDLRILIGEQVTITLCRCSNVAKRQIPLEVSG